MNKLTTYAIGGGVALLVLIWAAWFLFLRTPSTTSVVPANSGFGVGDNRAVAVPAANSTPNADGGAITAAARNPQKVFKVADGPIAAATLVQTLHPTTTVARYVLQENGHVFDLVLDNAGAVPRAVSNTTIPGAVRGVWAGSNAVVLQYIDNATVKSVSLTFPSQGGGATSTTTTTPVPAAPTVPVQIKFLPDNIADIAASPDGKNIVYLLSSNAGSDAYVAKSDGSDTKKLFTLPLSQLLVSWPASSTQLLWTKSADGVPGAAFSVRAASGGVVPLLYAPGLTVAADRAFAHVLYQSSPVGSATTYVHNTQSGADTALSFAPAPERCVWSTAAQSLAYCPAPLEQTPAAYIDLWHKGVASMADTIVFYNFATGGSGIVTTPGSADGGVASDIAQMAVSPDDKYLLFIKKGDRSLWGVRLGVSQ